MPAQKPDEDNPEWTKRARPPHEILPAEVLKALPNTETRLATYRLLRDPRMR